MEKEQKRWLLLWHNKRRDIAKRSYFVNSHQNEEKENRNTSRRKGRREKKTTHNNGMSKRVHRPTKYYEDNKVKINKILNTVAFVVSFILFIHTHFF